MGYIDFLGCISAFAVVMLHTNEVFHIFSYEAYWVTANAIECLMYFAVPVFLLISAATLLNYRERYSTKEFFIRRMHKTLIPFFVCIQRRGGGKNRGDCRYIVGDGF